MDMPSPKTTTAPTRIAISFGRMLVLAQRRFRALQPSPAPRTLPDPPR